MNANIKSAIKERTKAWNERQRNGFDGEEDMLTKKCEYLQDLLVIYQEEVTRLGHEHTAGALSRRRSSMRTIRDDAVAGVAEDDEQLSLVGDAEATHYRELYQESLKEIKQLMEDVAFLRTEQARAVAKATEDFQKALARNNERHQQTMRVALQEADMDRTRMEAVEAELLRLKADRDAKSSEAVMAAQHQIDALESEISALKREVVAEQRRAADFERELAASRRRVNLASEFLAQLDDLSETVLDSLVHQCEGHRRQVDQLLNVSSSIAQGQDQSNNESFRGSGGGADQGGGEDGRANGGHPDAASSAAAAAVAGAVESTTSDLRNALLSKLNKGHKGNSASPHRLQQLLGLWAAESEAQQLELAVAIRCAEEQHQQLEKATHTKLMESFGHCELLMQRIQQMDTQHAEMKEFVQQERDRALDARDRAIVLVRAMEQAKDRRSAVTSVGVQTTRSEMTGR